MTRQYVINTTGRPVRDPISLEPIPVSRAVRVGRHYFDDVSLRQFFLHTNNPRNPLTREPFPPEVLARYGKERATRQSAANQNKRKYVERRRLMLAFDDVLDELRRTTKPRYARTVSRSLSRVPSLR